MTAEQLPPQASVDWSRGKWSSIKGKYSREHTWLLDGGVKLRASDAEFLLPEGYRDGVRLDPEKTFVATIARPKGSRGCISRSATGLKWRAIATRPWAC